jgi:hypothetical protein
VAGQTEPPPVLTGHFLGTVSGSQVRRSPAIRPMISWLSIIAARTAPRHPDTAHAPRRVAAPPDGTFWGGHDGAHHRAPRAPSGPVARYGAGRSARPAMRTSRTHRAPSRCPANSDRARPTAQRLHSRAGTPGKSQVDGGTPTVRPQASTGAFALVRTTAADESACTPGSVFQDPQLRCQFADQGRRGDRCRRGGRRPGE